MKSSNVTKAFFCLVVSLLFLSSFAYGDTHQEVQAVDPDGYGTHPDLLTNNKVTVEGIVLNRPDFMLDSTPDEYSDELGGQWQIYIQSDVNDHAGTAVWMGQCYDNIWGGDGTYTDPNWTNELYRLSYDPCTAYEISPGDRVRVTGLLKFYRGKTNINERHSTNPDNDLTIELVELGVGLPQPEVITLDEVKDGNDNFIFDASRLTGCEYYQARLVRINDVNFVDNDPNWGPDNYATIQDAEGLTLPVYYGRGPGFSKPINLSSQFDVIGIFDQESSDMWVCNDGYRIWVLNYDGNGKILTDFGFPRNRLPGDINMDGKVDFFDLAEFGAHWLEVHPEGS